jgi:Protein of unknown function (DUF1559)
MSRSIRIRWQAVAGAGLAILAVLALLPFSTETPAAAQPPTNEELPAGLKFVPSDAAFFLYADVAKIWDHSIVKDIRKADAEVIEQFLSQAKKEFGLSPADVKSVVLFVPKFKSPADSEQVAFVVTFNKAFDKAKVQAIAEKLLSVSSKPLVVAPDNRTALVLLHLKEEDVKPQPAGKTGPLTEAIKNAASGKYAAVAGSTLASLPDELRGDEVPAQIRPFQSLFKAITITATLDVEKAPTLDVRVRTGTAAQAIDCEKSLGALLSLIQDELTSGLKELDAVKEPALKDLVTLMKAAGTAAKSAKFSTLGNETRLTVSLPLDLPFGAAFVAARKKAQDAAAVSSSANNLKQIAIAMHNYHDTMGNFPPAAVCDKTGKPQLSWRVLILPYVEQDALYKQFKLDEPWDSPNNKKLIEKMPRVYAMPGKSKPGDTDTYYRVFVGNGAGFDWLMGGKIQNITDGTSNTIMCITAADAVPWTKPDELAFDPDKDMGKLFGNVVNGKYQMALFDGSVRSFKKLPSKETIKALITANGGEVIGDDFP